MCLREFSDGDKAMKEAFLNNADVYSNTALMVAGKLAHSPMIRCLLQNGANPNAMNRERDTALTLAIRGRSAEAVRCLLAFNADANTQDISGVTPLMLAFKSRSGNEIVEALVLHGASVTAEGPEGYHPVHYAAQAEAHGSLGLLATLGADVNACNSQFRTAMHLAALANDGETVGKLYQLGASLNSQDSSRQTPLHYAAGEFNEVAVKALLSLKANPNIRGNFGFTPLHLAINISEPYDSGKRRCLETVKLLHRHNANLNAQDHRGRTALDYARIGNHFYLEAYLLAHGAQPGASGHIFRSLQPRPQDMPDEEPLDKDASDESASDEDKADEDKADED